MSSRDGSEASSYDSNHYGDVARAGYSRMYVLSHSALAPLDQRGDYRQRDDDDGDGGKEEDGDARADGPRASHHERFGSQDHACHDGEPTFQLLYMNGNHYFHGTIDLPDGLAAHAEEDDVEAATTVARAGGRAATLSVDDLPLLLPHFQQCQDELACVDRVTDFCQELRDVVYQMEEVGEFMVEELSKDKVLARIDEGAKEFHWMVSPQNPTFFELQTYPQTNASFTRAGVVLIVLKLVVRGVLLDVVYHKDSYFIVLRENADELALEDVFIPNVSCVGPCFVVRRYRDEDIKQLLLWCAFPSDLDLVVEGKHSGHCCPDETGQQLHLPAKSLPNVLKVAPVRTDRKDAILHANDPQLYCVLPMSSDKKALEKASRKRKHFDESDDDQEAIDRDEAEQECSVVFQFNQYVYSGACRLRMAATSDLGRLSRHVLPSLKAQAFETLTFFGSLADCVGVTELPMPIRWIAHVRSRFPEIAATLMDLVTESQSWVERFLEEVDAAARANTASPEKAAWLGSHLRSWLDDADGTEYFFELETRVPPTKLWGPLAEEESQELQAGGVSLMLWKGIVHQVVVVVVDRRGSFFVVLRDLRDVASMPRDGLEFFGLVPELDGKGRGYLVRSLPVKIETRSHQWLSGAKLLLWQTMGSVAREDLAAEDAQSRWLQSQGKRDEDKETAAWFEDKDDEKPRRARNAGSLRKPERVDDYHNDDDGDGDAKLVHSSSQKTAASAVPRSHDKSGRRHHLAPLGEGPRSLGPAPVAPWDVRTGRPL